MSLMPTGEGSPTGTMREFIRVVEDRREAEALTASAWGLKVVGLGHRASTGKGKAASALAQGVALP